MSKTNIKDILKPGANLSKVRIIDYNSPEQQERLRILRKQVDECLRRKRVNWDKISRMYITI